MFKRSDRGVSRSHFRKFFKRNCPILYLSVIELVIVQSQYGRLSYSCTLNITLKNFSFSPAQNQYWQFSFRSTLESHLYRSLHALSLSLSLSRKTRFHAQ